MDLLSKKAVEIIGFLSVFPEIKACSLYGSLADGPRTNILISTSKPMYRVLTTALS